MDPPGNVSVVAVVDDHVEDESPQGEEKNPGSGKQHRQDHRGYGGEGSQDTESPGRRRFRRSGDKEFGDIVIPRMKDPSKGRRNCRNCGGTLFEKKGDIISSLFDPVSVEEGCPQHRIEHVRPGKGDGSVQERKNIVEIQVHAGTIVDTQYGRKF